MKIFELNNNQPAVTVEALLVPEFKKIWDRDKTKDKSKAFNELRYIYFSTDYKSLYLSINSDDRAKKLAEDFMGDEKWKPDKDIISACMKYKEFQNTPTMRFLEDNQSAMESMGKYFRSIDWHEDTERGQPRYKITEVSAAVKNAGGIIDNIEKLKEKVSKEQSLSKDRARGQGSGGLLEFE